MHKYWFTFRTSASALSHYFGIMYKILRGAKLFEQLSMQWHKSVWTSENDNDINPVCPLRFHHHLFRISHQTCQEQTADWGCWKYSWCQPALHPGIIYIQRQEMGRKRHCRFIAPWTSPVPAPALWWALQKYKQTQVWCLPSSHHSDDHLTASNPPTANGPPLQQTIILILMSYSNCTTLPCFNLLHRTGCVITSWVNVHEGFKYIMYWALMTNLY